MENKKPLFILVGPTAIGKTSLSIELAKRLNGEIISADSMQIYKYMDIGTAKIKDEEKEGIDHYLIDEVCPDEEFSVSDFQDRACNYIEIISQKNKLPMVVGGTGLYINSLIYDLDFSNAVSNWSLREEYTNKASVYGNKYIFDELKKVDPESAQRLHINDTKRIIRALEIYHETGKPMSEFYKDFRQPSNKFKIVMVGLNMDRDELYNRINKRVDIMISDGLINEVKVLLDKGYSEKLTSMKGIGYKEIIKYLNGEYSLEEAIDTLKRESRRYAKRQLTWFRREKDMYWINIDEFKTKDEILNNIINYIKESLNISRI
ncbi:tRNA Delta(2)-isopentenylpyrophosphate transferase MiaA [Gottschalkia acidurici 9a]|uniref:tRNA dimethylallyltransferase n=1 Tax=Gottschalkia acidurici (strain ATCC 7906 / DSM 604 / BCRC 14475 / CIP 104303 / KCTC 5404 / NCIMB 10678 / 9a) TaxID=1128398 RepID=K0AXH8_GOTA9|nr:tRNA (adenosine(37)-N6)-dimethylallyltransferase MiaA [Gottschalkia acidurici]AFS78528.1 tRNA Delta(2)-isopentenylpyrophosphate transferase MiaA [Gottschalkia acidurici 9a]